jgi:hypothetical protein
MSFVCTHCGGAAFRLRVSSTDCKALAECLKCGKASPLDPSTEKKPSPLKPVPDGRRVMTAFLSHSPTDKLQACLNHDWDGPDRDFPVEYLQACAQWFADLSDGDRRVAGSAVWVYASGDHRSATMIAADLPAAPRCPPHGE